MERFAKEELPLLVEQGYLTEFCKVSSYLVREEEEKIMGSDVNIMFKEESEAHTETELDSGSVSPERGSPSLVGRGIANPMSERTRGFEMLLKGSTSVPLPAPFFNSTRGQRKFRQAIHGFAEVMRLSTTAAISYGVMPAWT